MLAVVQRVTGAEVKVDGERVTRIGRGLVAFVGVEKGDGEEETGYLASKLSGLRIFPDAEERMNLCLEEVEGELLLVPNFTVAGDCRKGRRPSFDRAAAPEEAEALLQRLGSLCQQGGVEVRWGAFGKRMEVLVENDGPVTVLIDTSRRL